MKKFLSVLLTFVMILSSLTLFVGCADSGNPGTGIGDTEGEQTQNGPLKIAVLSDIHLECEDEKAVRNFKTAVQQCTDYAGKDLDVVLCVGDMLDSVWYGSMKYEGEDPLAYSFYFGSEAGGENDYLGKELQMLVDVMDETIPQSTKFMYCLGNHDMISSNTGGGGDKSTSGNPYGIFSAGLPFDYSFYKDYFGRSQRKYFQGDEPDRSYMGDEGTQLTEKNLDMLGARYFKLGNAHFVSLSNTAYWTENAYSSNQLAWLDATFDYIDEKYPNDNILFITHNMIKNTTSGSGGGSGSIGNILKKYPQVITFTGHDHNTIYNENALWQNDGYTVVEAASVQNTGNNSYFGSNPANFNTHYANDSDAASQGLLVTIETNSSVRIERMDFTAGTKVGSDWVIPAVNSANRVMNYKKFIRDTNNVAPEFSVDARPYGEVVGNYLNVRWGAASADDNDVWAYRVVATYNNVSTKTLLVSPDRSVNDPNAEFYCSFANASTISYVTVTAEDSLFKSSRAHTVSSSDFTTASAVTPSVASVATGTKSSSFTLDSISLGDYTINACGDYIASGDGVMTNYRSTFAKGMMYFDGVYGKNYYFSFDMSKLRCNRSYTNSGYSDAKLSAGVCLATWGYNGKLFSLIAQLYFSDGYANGKQVPRPQMMKLTYYLVQQSNSSVGWATYSQIAQTKDITQEHRNALSSDSGAKLAINREGTYFTIYFNNVELDSRDLGGEYFYGNTFVPFTTDTTAAFGVATNGGEAYFSNPNAVINA